MGSNTHGSHLRTLIGQVNQHEYLKEQKNPLNYEIEDHVGHLPWPKHSHVANESQVQDDKHY